MPERLIEIVEMAQPRSVCHLLRLCSDREHVGRRAASARSRVGFDNTISQRFMGALMSTFWTHKVGTDRHPGALGRQTRTHMLLEQTAASTMIRRSVLRRTGPAPNVARGILRPAGP